MQQMIDEGVLILGMKNGKETVAEWKGEESSEMQGINRIGTEKVVYVS